MGLDRHWNQYSDLLASVPVSRLPQLVYETKKDMANSGIKSTIVGHVGDGRYMLRSANSFADNCYR